MNIEQIRADILLTFKELRSRGVVAKANFSCCSSCASYEIFEDKKSGKYKNAIGYTFWNKQSEKSVFNNRNRYCINNLHLQFGSFSDDEKDGLFVGRLIVDTLRARGLLVNWNDDISKSIEIDISGMLQTEQSVLVKPEMK